MWEFKKLKEQEFVPLMTIFIEMYQPDVYVEIGVQNGHTFNQISPLVKEAYAVDIQPIPNVKRTNNVKIYQMHSSFFAQIWDENKKIDLLFIDADHRRNAVLTDFDILSKFVTPGTGLVLLHDTYPSTEYLLKDGWCSNAWEAAREIHVNEKYKKWEIVTLPGPFAGISILRNAEKHLHWK